MYSFFIIFIFLDQAANSQLQLSFPVNLDHSQLHCKY